MKVLFLKLNRWSAWGWKNLDIYFKSIILGESQDEGACSVMSNFLPEAGQPGAEKFLCIKKIFGMLVKFSNVFGCKKEKQSMGRSGFTLLELVIVMAMIGILSSASFKLIRLSDTHRNLSMAIAELKGSIRFAQTLALAPPVIESSGVNRTICGFGVRNTGSIGADKLEIFYAYSNNGEAKDCRIISDISDVCSGLNTCEAYELRYFRGFQLSQNSQDVKIFFRAPYGKIFGSGVVKIIQDGQGYFKNIEINDYGKINIVP